MKKSLIILLAALLLPLVMEAQYSFTTNNGVLTIAGASNQVVVVQASTNLLNWLPLKTNTPAGTPLLFLDPNWRNFPRRFYRVMGQ